MGLNSRVILRKPAPGAASDDHGQPIPGWTEVARLWAEIKHQSGIGAIRAGAETSALKVSIKIWRRAGINAGMQIVHDGVAYSIEAVLPDLVERRYTFLVCGVVQ